MTQSLTRLIVHAIFSTNNREPMLLAEVRPELYAYIGGILKSLGCVPLSISGTNDHVHLLFILSKTIPLAKVFEEVKGTSSQWIKTQPGVSKTFAWQGGYGAFSVSESQREKVSEYIARQEEHHRKLTFKEELLTLFQKHHIEYDEKYLWT
ncbi:MAG: IS200/IS605 family transposase [Planctomycetaceae bacterium]|nr:IS200/IS605 family transposase [Planctomycetaceae bacterium]